VRLLLLAVACCALSAFAPLEGPDDSSLRQLTGAEIETRITGHFISIEGASDDHGDNFCQIGRWSTGGRIPIHGAYHIENDRLCVTSDLPGSQTRCHRYFADNENDLYEEVFDSVRAENAILPITARSCATE
jgi:hypothetical protein